MAIASEKYSSILWFVHIYVWICPRSYPHQLGAYVIIILCTYHYFIIIDSSYHQGNLSIALHLLTFLPWPRQKYSYDRNSFFLYQHHHFYDIIVLFLSFPYNCYKICFKSFMLFCCLLSVAVEHLHLFNMFALLITTQ